MPAKNVIKTYFADGFYHVYNRGVEKKRIFLDKQDHVVFLAFLKRYLTPPPEDPTKTLEPNFYKSLHDEIELLAYCLMPNHFHLLLKQTETTSMARFLQRVSTSYSIYFNRKYERVGPLFQGPYKAAVIDNENYFLHLSRYIHLNPFEILKASPYKGEALVNLLNYEWSSYADYLGKRHTEWVKTEMILSYFADAKKKISDPRLKGINTYQAFVESYKEDSKDILQNLALD